MILEQALVNLRPGAEWTLSYDKPGIKGLTWLDKVQSPPTAKELNAEVSRLEALPATSPLEEIRLLEQQHADTQAKLSRQNLLASELDRFCKQHPTLTREQCHARLIKESDSYAALHELEQKVIKLREKLQ